MGKDCEHTHTYMYPVSCILYPLSCILNPVSCICICISILSVSHFPPVLNLGRRFGWAPTHTHKYRNAIYLKFSTGICSRINREEIMKLNWSWWGRIVNKHTNTCILYPVSVSVYYLYLNFLPCWTLVRDFVERWHTHTNIEMLYT